NSAIAADHYASAPICHHPDTPTVAAANDRRPGGSYRVPTTFTPSKEATMKASATHKLTRLAISISTLSGLLATAAANGHTGWSDETLKQEIQPIASPLERMKAL